MQPVHIIFFELILILIYSFLKNTQVTEYALNKTGVVYKTDHVAVAGCDHIQSEHVFRLP